MSLGMLVSCAGDSEPSARPPLLPISPLHDERMSRTVADRLTTLRYEISSALAEPTISAGTLAGHFGQLGVELLAFEFDGDARVCFENARRLDPRDHRWPYYLGHTLDRLGHVDSSLAAFDRATQLSPDNGPLRLALVDGLFEADRLDQARRHLLRAAELLPAAAAPRIGLARLSARERDFAAAVQLFEEALRLEPAATQIHYPLGLAYRALGDLDRARFHLDRRGSGRARIDDPLHAAILRRATGARALNLRGDYARLEGRLEAARDLYAQTVEVEPDNVEYRVDLGATWLELDELDSAAIHLKAAVQLDSTHAVGHYNVALLLVRQGRQDQARSHFLNALRFRPDYRDAHLNLGALDLRSGRHRDAARHFDAVVHADPLHAGAHYGKGMALMYLGIWSEAHDWLTASHDLVPGSLEIAAITARLLAACPLARHRDGEEALTIARALVAADRSLSHIEIEAMALAELGRFAQAIALQQQIIATARQARLKAVEQRLQAALEGYQKGHPMRVPLGSSI